jgi:hypothetical protein
VTPKVDLVWGQNGRKMRVTLLEKGFPHGRRPSSRLGDLVFIAVILDETGWAGTTTAVCRRG